MLLILLQINGFQVPSLTIWILAWIFLIIDTAEKSPLNSLLFQSVFLQYC
jgi:hypothetical protein